MQFSPTNFTFDDFEKVCEEVVNIFSFIDEWDCNTEDSVPWLNIYGKKTIKPKDALKILELLQEKLVDQVLFNSLNGKELRIVVNGKFHLSKEELAQGFDEEYAYDFGDSIEEMKEEYNL